MNLFLDSCSTYDTAIGPGRKWSSVNTPASFTVGSGEGRIGDALVRGSGAGYLTFAPLYTQTGPWTPSASGVFGCAYKVDTLTSVPGGITGESIFNFTNTFLSVTYATYGQFGIGVEKNGTLSLYKWSVSTGPTLLAASIQALQDLTYVFLEVQWTIHATAGNVQVWANNTPILTYNGPLLWSIFGFASPPALWNGLRTHGISGTPTRMCDVYLNDLVAPNGARFGDKNVLFYKPDGVGSSSGWAPSAGANWQCVDGVPPNDTDTPSVAATTVGDRDSYAMEAVAGDPLAIQLCYFGRRVGSGTAGITPSLHIGGVDYDSPNEHAIAADTFAYKLQPMDVSPATGVPFTKAELDAAGAGQLKSL